jgi:hypothetical protein
VRSATVPAGLAQRARIVLLAAEGLPDSKIADRVGVTRQTVVSRRVQSAQRGLASLDDATPPDRSCGCALMTSARSRQGRSSSQTDSSGPT